VQPSVILSKLEQEYLLRVLESALLVHDRRQFFLLTQGQLQALLPHQVMVCMQFDDHGALLRLECLHGSVFEPGAMAQLCDGANALAPRIARHCSALRAFPSTISCTVCSAPAEPLSPFQQEISNAGFDNLLIHGSAPLRGGATVFALFGMAQRPGPREAYFLQLLLPQLHMVLLGLADRASGAAPQAASGMRSPSAREIEVLQWLSEGKSNYEIACILGISPLTVKNHLQRIYQNLGVSNRTQAVSRCLALRLLPEGLAIQDRVAESQY
jgi:transcriptional regulator EpsA